MDLVAMKERITPSIEASSEWGFIVWLGHWFGEDRMFCIKVQPIRRGAEGDGKILIVSHSERPYLHINVFAEYCTWIHIQRFNFKHSMRPSLHREFLPDFYTMES